MKFVGYIKKINTKSGTGRKGPWTLYSAKVEKTDGTEYEEWLSFGFKKPDVEEGKFYEIEAEKSDRGSWEVKSANAATPPKQTAATSSGGNGINTQTSIHYQNARNTAIEFVRLAAELEALPFIKTAGKAGEAKRFDELEALVNKMTVQFFFDTETLRLLESVEDAGNFQEPDDVQPGEATDGEAND